jgi:hypothetical protein
MCDTTAAAAAAEPRAQQILSHVLLVPGLLYPGLFEVVNPLPAAYALLLLLPPLLLTCQAQALQPSVTQ